ncbi:MAG: adenylate cyclase regulatory domain-containing protein [Thermoleophilaceae bacterium]
MAIDFEKEGLLDGLEGEEARKARLELLEELASDGVSLEELKRAAAEDRLALIPVERVLTPEGPRYTANEVAERSGVDPELLEQLWRALGFSLADPDDPVYSEQDVEAAVGVKLFMDAGLPAEGILEISRMMGVGMTQLAAAITRVFGEALIQAGDTERDAGLRQAEAAKAVTPQIGPMLEHVLSTHLRQQVRRAAIGSTQLATGHLPGGFEVAVCFADLVGFTRLGERLPGDELGAVAGRLADLASGVASEDVRLVKLIGDAAMFVSQKPAALVDATLSLVEAAENEGEDFPELRAGLAYGEALTRGGDWFGRPVNLASRVTDTARRGSVLATEELRETAGDDGFAWSAAGRRRLKGVKEPVRLWRVRRAARD